jgi:hypothetical protein
MHITELFKIPSTLKNQKEKLKDDFLKTERVYYGRE